MINPRLSVRQFLRQNLAAKDYGFNAVFARVAAECGVKPFDLDWEAGSPNVVEAFLYPQDVALSQLIKWPGCVIYTSLSQDIRKEKGRQYSGAVMGHIDFVHRVQKGVAGSDAGMPFNDSTEILADAIDATINEIFDPTSSNVIEIVGVKWQPPRSPRQPITTWGTGYELKVPFEFTCEVNL